MKLIKEMPKIAAKILKNTRGSHPDFLKGRLELLELAYTAVTVARDFEEWCVQQNGVQVKYPISEYLKVVDSRLGLAPEEEPLQIADPRVSEITSMSYELTGFLPPAKAVAELLVLHSIDEVKAALTEFVEGLTEREMKTSIKAFFVNGGSGAVAVIAARKRRTHGN